MGKLTLSPLVSCDGHSRDVDDGALARQSLVLAQLMDCAGHCGCIRLPNTAVARLQLIVSFANETAVSEYVLDESFPHRLSCLIAPQQARGSC